MISCLRNILLFMLVTNSAVASVSEDLAGIWSSLGAETVTNEAHYYKGQKGGHYTLGSMYFARQKRNRPIISVNPPEIDLDKSCYSQGVLNFGGISFISGDELKSKITNIAKGVGLSYAYLGLNAVSPVLGEVVQEVYSKLQELGGFLADECQVAKQIVSFAGDKPAQFAEKAKDIVSRFKLSSGKTEDLSGSYSKFPKGKDSALKGAAEKDERLILEDVNLAWRAIDKLKITSNELKEMMMTISGTVIIKSSGTDKSMPKVQYISSTVTSPSVLEALLKGNKDMKLISCSDTIKCLDVVEKNVHITEDKSFERKVTDYLDLIKKALIEDSELEASAQKFLANAGLPAYAIYDVLYQFTQGNPEYEQGIFVEVIAWNILYNYLADMLREVNEAANNLELAASSELKEFRDSIKSAQQLLNNHEQKDLSRYKLQLFLVKRAENMEHAMADEMSEIISYARSN
ncbi:conjugal transfer pilus assembly protein TraH (plasmid) [Rickettsiales bacterium Ac37b]|nr:conjugal transfer pilus assembly protein TraH [Rickettsiales bacterium Ac37b]